MLHQDVVAFFDDPPADMREAEHETTDGDHGRIGERRHVVRHKVDWLSSDRPYADEPCFPHLAMIGMVESRIERNGAITRERRYYLSSTPLDAKTFAAAVRVRPLGHREPALTGFSTWSSTTISPVREVAMGRKTCPSSDT